VEEEQEEEVEVDKVEVEVKEEPCQLVGNDFGQAEVVRVPAVHPQARAVQQRVTRALHPRVRLVVHHRPRHVAAQVEFESNV